MIYNTGEIYEGNWEQDVINGYGKMTFKNNFDTYQGWWYNGKINNITTIEGLMKYI